MQIDEIKPGKLVSRSGRKLDSRTKTFEGLKQAAEKSVTFEGIALNVGQGNQVIAINVGEIPVDAAFIHALLTKVLEKFKPDTPITMSFRKCHFASGHDLKDFASKLGFELQQGMSSSERQAQTIDFGAPTNFGAHLFRVEIPASRDESVVIVEDYGYRGQEGGHPTRRRTCRAQAASLVRHRRHRAARVQ